MNQVIKGFSAISVGPQPIPTPCPTCGEPVEAWWKLTHWEEGGECDTCVKAEERRSLESAAAFRKCEELAVRLRLSGLYPKHLAMTFATWPGDMGIRARLQGWARIPQSNLLLTGPTGSGKSGALSAIANEAILTTRVKFIRSVDLIAELRRAERSDHWHPDNWDTETEVNQSGLLLIDDLGKERVTGSGFVEEKIFDLFDLIELTGRKGVAVTTNFNLHELGERLGEAVASRIAGNFEPVVIQGTDRRIE